jgi:hypothetical protein
VKRIAAPQILLALVLGGTMAVSSATALPATVPLVEGLTLVRSASERQGDYESTLTVAALDADGTVHLNASAELPDPAGGKSKPVSFDRDVRGVDRKDARTYRYM